MQSNLIYALIAYNFRLDDPLGLLPCASYGRYVVIPQFSICELWSKARTFKPWSEKS